MNTTLSDRRKFVLGTGLVIITIILYLLIVISKTPDMAMPYLVSIIPAVAGVTAMLYVASKSNDLTPTAICLLFAYILINANAYQTVFDGTGYIKSTLLNSAGLICGAGSLIFYTKFLKTKLLTSKKGYIRAIIITGSASVLMCLILLVFGAEVNGARLWISIGNYTLQLSEIVKFLVFVQYALIYNSNMSVRAKIISGASCLMTHCLFMILFYELGTVIVLTLLYLVVFFVHIRSRYSLLVIVTFALLLAIALGMVYGLHPSTQGATDSFSLLINKIYDRLSMSDTYQSDRAIMGVINGGLFGGADLSYIVEYYSMAEDFALGNLAQYFGIFNMIVFVIANAAIVYLVYLRGRDEDINNRSRYKLSFIFSSAIAIQTLLALSSLSGLVCGVGMPGLSIGGTQTIIYYVMAGFVMFGFLEDDVFKSIPTISTAKNIRSRFYDEYEV